MCDKTPKTDHPELHVTDLHPRAKFLCEGANLHHLVPQEAVAHDDGGCAVPFGWSGLDELDVQRKALQSNSGVMEDKMPRILEPIERPAQPEASELPPMLNRNVATVFFGGMPIEPLVRPVVNINGTSREGLVEQLMSVRRLTQQLLEAMGRAMPHGRDHGGMTSLAVEAWRQRLRLIHDIDEEVYDLAIKLSVERGP